MLEKKESCTPAEAKRAYDQLNHLVAENTLTPRQAGVHRRHIASRVRVSLKPAYNPQAARRAISEIVKLTEAGTIPMKSAAAFERTSRSAPWQPDDFVERSATGGLRMDRRGRG